MEAYREKLLRGLLRRGIQLAALDEVAIHLNSMEQVDELEERILAMEKEGGKLTDEKLLEIYHDMIK